MHVSSLRYNHGHPTYCSYSLVGVLLLLLFLSSLVLILWLLLHGLLHGARTTFGHPFCLDLLQVLYDRCHLIHCLLKHCEQGSCIGNLRFFPVTSIYLGCKWWHLSTRPLRGCCWSLRFSDDEETSLSGLAKVALRACMSRALLSTGSVKGPGTALPHGAWVFALPMGHYSFLYRRSHIIFVFKSCGEGFFVSPIYP